MLSHLTIEERQQQTYSSRNNVSVFIASNCLFACFGGRGRGRDFNIKEVKQVFFLSFQSSFYLPQLVMALVGQHTLTLKIFNQEIESSRRKEKPERQ